MGCIKLREKLSIPLMATEYSQGGFTNYVPWIINKATDYLRGDVAVKGPHADPEDRPFAEAFGMNYGASGGNSLNNWANLHVILSIRNTYLRFSCRPGAKYGIIDDLEPDADGVIHAPTAPGLGAKIDDLIKRKRSTCCDERDSPKSSVKEWRCGDKIKETWRDNKCDLVLLHRPRLFGRGDGRKAASTRCAPISSTARSR